MAILRAKDIRALNPQERDTKLKELKLELIKGSVTAQKGKAKTSEIKKTIARLLTLSKSNPEVVKK